MTTEIDIARLAEMIVQHRKALGVGVREAAGQIGGVSASTLSRVERGNLPDLDSYMRLCRWLDVSPTYFALEAASGSDAPAPEATMPEKIRMQLRSDPLLSPETKKALLTMIEVAYAAAKAGHLSSESQV